MRKITNINKGWQFIEKQVPYEQIAELKGVKVNVPFTWNGIDGQDGGGDYVRAAYWFTKTIAKPEVKEDEEVYLEFKGVNSSAFIYWNGEKVAEHHGGYSTFRVNVTDKLKDENLLAVCADNQPTEKVYPQTADFTFYGGIYRDVNIVIVNKNHFDMDFYGSCGVKITPTVKDTVGTVEVESFIKGEGEVKVTISDAEGKVVAKGEGAKCTITVDNARRWDGVNDPYLYSCKCELMVGGKAVDKIVRKIGFRTFKFDPQKGFFLNDKSYPLRGVCRHQDRPKIGNALSKADHDEDIEIIKEVGANTIRLAHYQHDDYFYDLCDENGFVVWAEIPYISRHMPEANENSAEQLKELIYQQYNHASIVMWSISNEITMFNKHKEDMLENHRRLNDLAHKLDPTRATTLACFSMCMPNNKSSHITDVVAWNLYFGWYVPGFFINDLWIDLYHKLYPNSCLGYSEYGAECMPNLHSAHPHRGDNTEEYQASYHEYLLRCFEKRPFMWGTYVWNMFDFAADARNQGGEPGMNHKGLVTFDRKTRKDSFYAYKAYWSKTPFVQLGGKRFVNRTGSKTEVKVYTNTGSCELYVNGELVKGKTKDNKVFVYKVKLSENTEVKAVCGELTDSMTIHKVAKPDPAYKLHVKSETQSWQH